MTATIIEPPPTDAQLRDALYNGAIVHGSATIGSRALVERAWAWVREAFPEGDPRTAPASLDGLEMFRRIGALRRRIFESHEVRRDLARMLREFGLDPSAYRFDPPKLRVVMSDGHENPRAAALYAAHRDTWYGHPQSLITWWVPLHAARQDETFVFFPDALHLPVDNDSHTFEPENWTHELRIGWQDADAGLRETYPALTQTPERALERREGFACERADNLLFSGAHLHQTLPQSFGTTRYSLDFRLAHIADSEASRGAPNVDDRSGPAAFGQYYDFPTGC